MIIILLNQKNKNVIYIATKDKTECVMMYYTDHNEVLVNDLLSYKDCCINITNKENKCNGLLLMKILMRFLINNKFKKIIIDDQSTYYCNSSSYKLIYANTLCYGTSWYFKYGFRFINDKDNKRMEQNKKKLEKIKINDIKLDILIKVINDIESKFIYKITDEMITKSINDITDYYNKNLDKNIDELFGYIKYNYCDIFCQIYEVIYESLELNRYKSSKMYMNLFDQ